MITQERKDELYDEMFGWICEHIHDSYDLYITLHEHFGMSMEELHDHCIESLDEFFPENNTRAQFERKIRDAFEGYKASWMRMTSEELIRSAGKIAAVQHMAEALPESASEKDMEYLLRFKNPLEVVSDAWYSANGPGTVIDEELNHVLWSITDRQDMESVYELEEQYCQEDGVLSMEGFA